MIDTLLNLLFRCPHHRLTRPLTPLSRAGVPQGDTYVVCLECGKQFAYDLKKMRVGKPIGALPHPDSAEPRTQAPPRLKVKHALWASLPLGLLLGVAVKSRRKSPPEKAGGEGKGPFPPG